MGRAATVYAQELSAYGYGHPLWCPEPTRGLDGCIRGIHLGDVGYIDEDGGFRRLFNVTVSANHELNTGGVPEGFTPVEYNESLRSVRDNFLHPRPFCSETVEGRCLEGGASADIAGIGGGEISYSFRCSSHRGAFLILKDHATKASFGPYVRFEEYMLQNHDSWYAFATDPSTLGIRCEREDIVLVRGTMKTSAWTVGAFLSKTDDSHELSIGGRFGLVAGATVQLSSECARSNKCEQRSGPNRASQGSPSPIEPSAPTHRSAGGIGTYTDYMASESEINQAPKDQCVFVSYYKIRYRRFLPKKITANAGSPSLDPEDSDYDEGRALFATSVGVELDTPHVPPRTALEDALDYILEYSDADTAIASHTDIEHLLSKQADPTFSAALRELKPRILVNTLNTGQLEPDLYHEVYDGPQPEAVVLRGSEPAIMKLQPPSIPRSEACEENSTSAMNDGSIQIHRRPFTSPASSLQRLVGPNIVREAQDVFIGQSPTGSNGSLPGRRSLPATSCISPVAAKLASMSVNVRGDRTPESIGSPPPLLHAQSTPAVSQLAGSQASQVSAYYPRPMPHAAPPHFLTQFQVDEKWHVTDELLADIDRADQQHMQGQLSGTSGVAYAGGAASRFDSSLQRLIGPDIVREAQDVSIGQTPPLPNESFPRQKKKALQAPQACASCSQRKIICECEDDVVSCKQCIRRGLPCSLESAHIPSDSILQQDSVRFSQSPRRITMQAPAIGLIEVPQRPYAANIQRNHTSSYSTTILFSSDRGRGVRLADVDAHGTIGLSGADDKVLQGFGMKVTYRIEWPGYGPYSKQKHARRATRDKQSVSRAKVAAHVAEVMREFISDVHNKSTTEPEWKVGFGTIEFDDLYLLEVRQVAEASLQPVIAFVPRDALSSSTFSYHDTRPNTLPSEVAQRIDIAMNHTGCAGCFIEYIA